MGTSHEGAHGLPHGQRHGLITQRSQLISPASLFSAGTTTPPMPITVANIAPRKRFIVIPPEIENAGCTRRGPPHKHAAASGNLCLNFLASRGEVKLRQREFKPDVPDVAAVTIG